MLPRLHQRGEKARRIIEEGLVSILQPGEAVLTYADRELRRPGLKAQKDALAYKRGHGDRQTDAFAYHKGHGAETDAFAYDTERAREQTDVMGYQAGGPKAEVDALAYHGAAQTPDTDAFVSDAAGPRAADVDLLVLTDRRLMRGTLRDEQLEWREVPCEEGGVCVNQVPGASTHAVEGTAVEAVLLDITLPVQLCDEDEETLWCWEVPAGVDVVVAAERWSGSRGA
jgi:hypothetical protein